MSEEQAIKNDLLEFLSKDEAWHAIRGMDAPGLATELEAAGFRRLVGIEPSEDATGHGDLIAWHIEQVESLRPFIRSSAHLKAAMMHAATVRALRAPATPPENREEQR
ncbi:MULTISPECIES: hypothetical protein [unclassified Microbacterium]|uniref:hypothetical protein n=1 Tax=unclassified Microbacterium TaxID=2609290 RepID=UPI000EA9A0F3|nr:MULTISPECIES: hypothetical protein [unclassified Microbacterium]MBT2485794.1 hypothetical protein [Microbacterium sp. ISL-108]RKN68556.1 hypothetical protein D7252_13840 [Microbacterium sp. CGR2]